MLKNQKGITLIALVITIIVLLILAGITIAMISGQDSTPNKAAQAKIQNEVGAAKDAVVIKAAELLEQFYEQKYVTNNLPNGTTKQSLVTTAANYPNSGDKPVVSSTITVTTTSNSITITSSEKDTQNQTCSVTGTVNADGVITWGNVTWTPAS